jgi:hypothetical protein
VRERRYELISGLGAGIIGILALAYALFGPSYSFERIELRADGTTSTTSGRASLLETQSLQPATVIVFVVLALLIVGVAAGAYLHARQGFNGGRWLLGISTAILGLGMIITGFSIGPLLFPSFLLALIATALADRAWRRERSAPFG